MNLREFFDAVERQKQFIPEYSWDHIQVKIPAYPGYTTIGSSPGVPVISMGRGIDWDSAYFFIDTDAALNFNGKAYYKKQEKLKEKTKNVKLSIDPESQET